jgi:N-acetylglucosaminyldiphosphoundecaprenol N-acetyl-beta-D-mannosaminyltransferase
VTGVDAVEKLAGLCWKEKRGIYLLGGEKEEVERVTSRLVDKFAGLRISVAAEHLFDEHGPDYVLKDIAEKKPAVLLVAYGAPKQTIWLENQRDKLPGVCVGVGVGGAFDILGEKLPRAPKLLRAMNIEWLWRFYLEPARAPRIWQAVVSFPLLIRKQKGLL